MNQARAMAPANGHAAAGMGESLAQPMSADPAAAAGARPFTVPQQAAEFCDALASTVDALIKVLDEESQLVRSARLTDAAVLHARKTALSAQYGGQLQQLKQNAGNMRDLAPDGIEMLRSRQLALEDALQANMTVLATARTVSETLIRGIAGDAASRRGGPTVYGSDARQPARATAAGAPIRVNAAI
ncbi:MAG: hypothetical protein H6878_11390 [Rhodobiaceae bacterium]|nr:hypothetical protein [Rhodobiaceae bacterium]